MSIVVEHGGARSEPQVQFARDILLFAQKRDPVNLPTAYPVAAAMHSGATAGGHA
jgi:hypothetical protein